MKIQLRFFASIREQVGTAQESITVAGHVQTVGDVLVHLRERGCVWSQALAEGRVMRMAFNQEMTDPGTRLVDGCEVAFFPPVTGG